MDSIKGQFSYLISEGESLIALDAQVERKAEIIRQKETALLTREAEAKKLQQTNISTKTQLEGEWKNIDIEKEKLIKMTETIKKEKSSNQAEIQQQKRDLEIREQKLSSLEKDRELLKEKEVELERQKVLVEKERKMFSQRMETVDALEKRLTDKLARFNNILKE